MFDKPTGDWVIVPATLRSEDDQSIHELHRYDVESFLRQFKSDYGVMAHLREVLYGTDPVSGFTDDQVIETVSRRLANRTLVLRSAASREQGGGGGGGGGGGQQGKAKEAGAGGATPAAQPKPKGAIRVHIIDDKGRGVATVEVTGPGTKKSNAGGIAMFESLAEGTYPVRVTTPLPDAIRKDYYLALADAVKQVHVTAGSVTDVTFKLVPRPWPTIKVDAPKIVLVKHAYQGKPKPGVNPHRIPVKLSFEGPHDGDGEFSSNHADHVVVFEKADDPDDKAKALPWTIRAADLKNKTVFVEGKAPSASMQDTELTLTLKNGSVPPKNNPATEKITCVLLKLDIFTWRDENNSAPVQIGEAQKIDPGRAVHLQGSTESRMFAQRAKMVLSKALPNDYPNKLLLKPISGSVQAFAADQEIPAHGQSHLSGAALHFANGPLDAAKGVTFWVEGQSLSSKMSDTGWTVELEELPGKEGDRVTMSVVKTELRLFKPKKDGAADPEMFSDGDKLKVGRFVHKQDGNRHRGQSIIHRVLPFDFTGKVFLTAWDIKSAPHSETKSGAPKVSLFDAATAGAAVGFGSDIPQAGGAPDDLKKFFIEGKTVSTELIDTQIRLGIRDVDPRCDRESVTVYQVEKVEVKLRGTPCKRGAKAVAAMPAGPAKDAAIAADGMRANTMPASTFNTDSLVFGASAITVVRECGDLKMTATVKPATVTLSWDIAQATDDAVKSATPSHAPDGDDKKHKVTANKTGSFNVFAFVDGNGDHKRAVEEDGVTVNVNMVELKVPAGAANNVVKRDPGFNNVRSTAGSLVVDSGAVGHGFSNTQTAYGDATFTGNAIAMKVTVQLFGGAADRKRGTDKVILGYIQTTTDDTITAHYADGKVEKEVIFANPVPAGAPDVDPPTGAVVGGIHPALDFPVRDHRTANTNGIGTVINSSSDRNDITDIATGGQQRIVRFVDPPAIGVDMAHPITGSALASISGQNFFQDFLMGFSTDFDENFVVVASAKWRVSYGTFTAAAGWTIAGAEVHAPASMTVNSPPVKGESTDMERCPPGFTDNLMMDAR